MKLENQHNNIKLVWSGMKKKITGSKEKGDRVEGNLERANELEGP